MSEARFCDAAARLAGIAGALAGWRPAEFWAATPAELAVIFAAIANAASADALSDAPPDASAIRQLREMFPDE